ncbi:MAG TPA: hypothetical protein DCQ50_15080, partial [Chryseobacterium sp.]|nr:hypothetical protein [Chryseobacterium sp.]
NKTNNEFFKKFIISFIAYLRIIVKIISKAKSKLKKKITSNGISRKIKCDFRFFYLTVINIRVRVKIERFPKIRNRKFCIPRQVRSIS